MNIAEQDAYIFERLGFRRQREIAAELGISVSAVSRRVSERGWRALMLERHAAAYIPASRPETKPRSQIVCETILLCLQDIRQIIGGNGTSTLET